MAKTGETTRSNSRYHLLALLSFAGFIVSSILTRHYYLVRSGAGEFKSYCNLSATFNCDAVASSRYADLIAGIPLSSFAAGWFVAILIIALIGRERSWRREVDRALLVMTALSALFSVVYFVIMAVQIKTYCLNCLITDGINLASLAVAASLQGGKSPSDTRPMDSGRWKTFGWVTAGSLLVFVLALQVMNPLELNRGMAHDMAQEVLASPGSTIAGAGMALHGPAGAPVVIQEFLDFQCPSCRMGAQTMSRVMERYGDKVRVVLRTFPLDSSCNPKGGSHPAGCESARAAICANQQGKLKEAYYTMFEEQESIVPGKPTAMARAIPGIDESKLLACMESAETRTQIQKDIEEGVQLGVQSTPTFFVNGRKILGAYPLAIWTEIFDGLGVK